ncbi:MFS transporter [Streptomyces sp. NPDC006529]|uniref:MFS transporter n=1 Tax=Streptomyces sp. NPDC006529 TaxID=3157177 RepID=UPI0033ADA4EE
MPFASYRAVLRAPHACRTFGAALLGRLSYGMVSLSLLLAVKDATGSYRAAGAVTALFGVASVSLSPVRARLVDRYGPRRALVPMAGAYAALLAALAGLTWSPGAGATALGALAMAAGCCTPPLGPVMRALWSTLVPDRLMLQRAYSLDGVAEELLFVSGPLLVGLLLPVAGAASGLAASGALILVGTLALVSSPVARSARGSAGTGTAGEPSGAGQPARGRGGLWSSGLLGVVVVSAGVGIGLGALDLLVVAFADQRHRSGAVPWVLAALSTGSALGGLAYGAVAWRMPGRRRLPLIAAALAVALTAAGLAPDVYVLLLLAALAGVFIAPALTTAYLVADESADPAHRVRAGAWVNTALNAGTAAGSAAVGLLVGRLPVAWCFALVAAPVLLSAAAVGVRGPGRGWSRPRRGARTGAPPRTAAGPETEVART